MKDCLTTHSNTHTRTHTHTHTHTYIYIERERARYVDIVFLTSSAILDVGKFFSERGVLKYFLRELAFLKIYIYNILNMISFLIVFNILKNTQTLARRGFWILTINSAAIHICRFKNILMGIWHVVHAVTPFF